MARIEMPEAAASITANASTGDVLFELGMMYSIGREVVVDYVAAHKWFNLAALKGNEGAKRLRSEISAEMSPAQISEAQRQARTWLTVH